MAQNGLRLKQIKEAVDYYDISQNQNMIIAGDFNYLPYARKSLERLMRKYGLTEATHNIRYTLRLSSDGKRESYNLLQKLLSKIVTRTITKYLKIDYIFYKNLTLKETKRINVGYSDHYPILSTFKI